MDDIPKLPKIDKKVDINKYFINFIKDNLVLFFMYFSLLSFVSFSFLEMSKYTSGSVYFKLKSSSSVLMDYSPSL